ncbi:hypothetical protein ANTRET_LOCUS9066 [Anthophora retusa]
MYLKKVFNLLNTEFHIFSRNPNVIANNRRNKFPRKDFPSSARKKRVTVSRRGESLVRYDKYGNTLELKVRLSR